jgi:hypothetical protein
MSVSRFLEALLPGRRGERPRAPIAAGMLKLIPRQCEESGEFFALVELGRPEIGIIARAELTPVELAQHMADCRAALTAMASHGAGENVIPIRKD